MTLERVLSDATANLEWIARLNADGHLVLARRVECVICCKRKRHLCKICHGTGMREAEYGIGADNAVVLVKMLGELL